MLSVPGSFLVFYTLALILALKLSPFPAGQTSRLVLGGLACRFALTLFLPHFLVFDDEYTYSTVGTTIALELQRGHDIQWDENQWMNVTGLLFYLFSDSVYTVRPFNTFLGIISAVLMARTVLALYPGEPRAALSVLRMNLFMPPMIVLSSIALKEQMIGFCLVLLVLGFARARAAGYTMVAAALLILYLFRPDLSLLVTLAALGHLTYRAFLTFVKGRAARVAGGIAGVLVIALVWKGIYQHEAFEELKLMSILKGYDARGESTLLESQATYASYLDPANPGSMRNLVLIPAMALYSPSPLRVVTSPAPEVYFEAAALTSFMYLATPWFLAGAAGSCRSDTHFFMTTVWIIVFLTAAFSVLTFAPEPFRYRWPGFPLFFSLAAIGRTLQPRYYNAVVYGWWMTVAVFAAMYLRSFGR